VAEEGAVRRQREEEGGEGEGGDGVVAVEADVCGEGLVLLVVRCERRKTVGEGMGRG
jgi:hypothetical protein